MHSQCSDDRSVLGADLWGRLCASVLGFVLAWRRRQRYRDLLDLDDHLLDDVGVTRFEVETFAKAPLWQNAAMDLRRSSTARRALELSPLRL